MGDPVMKAIARYLTDKGYVKMNPYLYMKSIKTDVVTGGTVLVNLADSTVGVITVSDRFLCFRKRPTVKVTDRHYSTLVEFRRFIQGNEKREIEFLKKDMEWRKKENGRDAGIHG